jgi:putative integral membrane protein (TIGR02587 family)
MNHIIDNPNRDYAVGLGRAFAGAIIFSLPLLMTMEMWWLGFYLDRFKLLLFVVTNLAVILGLSRIAGFEPTSSWTEDLIDTFAAYAIAVIASAVVLLLFGIVTPDMPLREIVGTVAIQTVPASFGAMIANKQLGHDGGEEAKRSGYGAQLFLMLAGALFLAFNVAPTEEMILISFVMTPWHGLALIVASVLLLHMFVYFVGFSGQEHRPEREGFVTTFFRFSIVGYGIALAMSLYVLWTFGRTDGAELEQIAMMTAVLAFPAAIGAAIARLVV